MQVGARVGPMSPAVAVSAVLVLGAFRGEMTNLVTSVATCLGLEVVGAVGMNMPHVTAHETEVVHVNDWRGSGMRRGVL